MSGSDYIKNLRSKVGNSTLLVPGVAAVILDQDRKILLQKKNHENWSLPAGMIEPGESPRESIIREVREETGLVVIPNKPLALPYPKTVLFDELAEPYIL